MLNGLKYHVRRRNLELQCNSQEFYCKVYPLILIVIQDVCWCIVSVRAACMSDIIAMTFSTFPYWRWHLFTLSLSVWEEEKEDTSTIKFVQILIYFCLWCFCGWLIRSKMSLLGESRRVGEISRMIGSKEAPVSPPVPCAPRGPISNTQHSVLPASPQHTHVPGPGPGVRGAEDQTRVSGLQLCDVWPVLSGEV